MKKNIRLTLAILLLSSCSLFAQSKDEKAVAAATEALRLAMISGNQQELDKVVSDKLSYGHSGGLVENKTAFLAKFASGQSDFVSINLTEQTIDVIRKTAIVRHKLTADTNDNQKPGTVNLKVMLVFVKDGGKWKLAARQAVKQS